MRSRSLVVLAMLLAMTLTIPSSTHAGFFSIFRKLLPLRLRILLGLCRSKDIPKIIEKVEGLYAFPQQEGLQTFKAEMLELSTRAANDFNKQWTQVSYQSTPEGGDAKIEQMNKGTVSKDTQKGVNQGMNVAGAKEFGNALFPRSANNEKVAYPNVKVRRKPMFPFSFFINDAALEFRPYSAKSYGWKIDSASQNGQSANNALGLAGGNVGNANSAIGDVTGGLNSLTQMNVGQGGLSSVIQFLQMATSLLTGFQGRVGGINGLLNQSLGYLKQGRSGIDQARGMIQDGSGKISEINDKLGSIGGGTNQTINKVQNAMGKLQEAGQQADLVLAAVDKFAGEVQNLGGQVGGKLQEMIGQAQQIQGQIGQIISILNMIMSLLGGGDGAGGGIQQALQGLGQANGALGAIAGIVDQFAGGGSGGGTNLFGEKVKTWVVQPTYTVRAQQSMAEGGGGGGWAYVFPKVGNSAGRTKLIMYTWLGVKFYYFPFPESITIRGTKNVSGFPVPRHILNVNWDTTQWPPLKVKLIFFRNQQVNVPVNMGSQGTEDELPVDDPAEQEKDRQKTYQDLRDTAEAVAENKMAAGHILAASRIAALAAASGAYNTLADVLDHMEEIVKNTVISEVGAADSGRASEDLFVQAAKKAQSTIDELIAAVPVQKDQNGNYTAKPIDPAKLKSILKGLCSPVRKAAASAARTLEALAAATDSEATKRFSEIKFNRMVEWALRAESQANIALATSEAKVAQRASKIAQAFEAQSKKDSGQVSQAASLSSEESKRVVSALDKAVAGTGRLIPDLTLSQRVLANAEDLQTDQVFDSGTSAESDDASIDVFGDYDPYDHDDSDGSTADTQRGPFSNQSADLVNQAFEAAKNLANSLPYPGSNFVSSGPPSNKEQEAKLTQVVNEVGTLNNIRRLLNLATYYEFIGVQMTRSRALSARGKIGTYASRETQYRNKAKELITQAANIGDDPAVITEDWTKPGKFTADTVFASTHLKKLTPQQLAMLVAQAQGNAQRTAARSAQLAEIANQKEATAFTLENKFIKKLLGAILRYPVRAHRRSARAYQAAASICGTSGSEKSSADKAVEEADKLGTETESDANDVNSAINTADTAHNDAHQARIDAILAQVDATLAEEELARLQDVLRTKTQGSGGTGGTKPGTGTGTGTGSGTGGTSGIPDKGPGSVTDELIKKIQDLMNDGKFDELVKLLVDIIKTRGLGDPLGRLAKGILDQLLADAIRVLEEIRESTNSNNNGTIFTGGGNLNNLLDLFGGTPVGTAGNDLNKRLRELSKNFITGTDNPTKGPSDGTTGSITGSGGNTGSGTGSTDNSGLGKGIGSGGLLFGGGSGGTGTGSGFAGRGLAEGDPNKQAENLFLIAQQKEKEGLITDALKLYNTIIEQFPKSEFVDPSRERIRALMGDPNVQKNVGDGAQVFLDRGIALMNQGDTDGALQMFNVVLNDFPTSPQAKEADGYRKKILSGGLVGGTSTGGTPHGRISDPQGTVDEAAQLFAQAQQFEKDGAFPEAIKNYQTIVSSFPESAFVKPSQGRLDALLGDPRIKQAIEDQAAILMSRGASLMEVGNLGGALQMFNSVIEDYPTSREVPKAQGLVADIQNRLQGGK